MIPTYRRIACFGGLYSNYLALEAAVADASQRQVEATFCLGDMGAFGPHPDRVFLQLQEDNIQCIQGNYDHSIGNQLDDCQCGYTDQRDNYFSEISYRYTLENTSAKNRGFLRQLPAEWRVKLGDHRVLLCHGSPRRTNEFLWESTTSSHFLRSMAQQHEADIIVGTHSGIKWYRDLGNDQHFVNVGVLGRPENDGRKNVWYTLLSIDDNGETSVEFVPVNYDHERLAREMRAEQLPEEFVETTLTGWWSTCLEILPGKERVRGKF